MSNLPEAGAWVDGVYQIETTDPVLGGAPNLDAKAGLSNVPAQQLAQRTRWLKEAIGGLGGSINTVTDLNALDKTGMYYFLGSAIGSPANLDGRVLHMESGGESSQIAVMGNDQMYFRDRDTAGADFTAWQRIWAGDYATSQARAVVESYGLGAEVPYLANADTLAKSGFYSVGLGTVGSPSVDFDGRLLHMHKSGEASQLAIFGVDYLGFRNKDDAAGAFGAWQRCLIEADQRGTFYNSDNAPDAWLIAPNFEGDTSVSLEKCTGYCFRVGKHAHLSLSLRFTQFSMIADGDGTVSGSFDINAWARSAGWFQSLSQAHLGLAQATFFGTNPSWDSPWLPAYLEGKASTGVIYFQISDRLNLTPQASNANEMHLIIQMTCIVGD